MCLHATTGRWDAAYGRSGAAVGLLARPSGKGVGTDENITRDGLLKLAGLAAAGGAAGLAVPARAGAQATEDYAILYVSQDGRDSNAGRSWENAKREVQGALDLVPSGGGVVYIGPGSYRPFSITNPPGRIAVVGLGDVKVIPTGSQPGITLDSSSSTPIVGPLIENIHVSGNGATSGSMTGIQLKNMKRATVRRCRVSGCSVGIDYVNDAGGFTERCSVESTLVNNCGTGLRFHRTPTGHSSFSYNQISNVGIDFCSIGIDIGGDSPAVPNLFGSAFLSTVVWGQTNGAICARVAGDISGCFMHLNLERIAGAGVIGYDVTGRAANTLSATVISKFIGAFRTRVRIAATKSFAYQDGVTRVVINGTGVVDEASYKHMNDGATFPSVRITNRDGTTAGKIELGSGAAAPDVELYREQADVLKTRDQFVTTKAISIMTKAGTPSDSDVELAVDGTMVIDTDNHRIWVRSGGRWKSVALA